MPAFGRSGLDAWPLDPDVTYLNHGTVGVAPRRVLDAQARLRARIERQPAQFLLRELSPTRVGQPSDRPPRIRQAADLVAAFLGARGSDLVFTDNITAAVNSVLHSIDWRAGDEIVVSRLGYGGIDRAVAFAARRAGLVVVRADVPFPTADPAAIVDAFAARLTPRTRLVIVDHITSESAIIMPVAAIAAAAHARGALVLVDAAHAPGGIAVDIPSLGVDFYAANLHKWAWTPRSCGILWANEARQAGVHPLVMSWGLDEGFTAEFDWVGTRDPTPWLVAPDALAYMAELGVDAVRRHNHDLAWQAGQYLTSRWGTTIETPEAFIGTMMTVPLPPRLGSTPDEANRLRDALLFEHRIEVQLHAWNGRLWARISAQIYNDMGDVERLAGAVGLRLEA